MTLPTIPSDETRRLATLHALNILDTPVEERFDRLTRLATQLFKVPIALVSLIDHDRQWFKSSQGLNQKQTPRAISFCAHALTQKDTLLVKDSLLDPRFADNPLVTGEPHIRFYAGQPLIHPNGSHLGTLCIIDRVPRDLTQAERQALRDLAGLVEEELNEITSSKLLQQYKEIQEEVYFQAHLLNKVQQAVVATDQVGNITYWNDFAEKIYGWSKAEVLGQSILDIIPPSMPPEEAVKVIADHASSDESVSDEYELRRRDGKLIPVQASSTPIYAENGQMIGIVGISNDISVRKQTEVQLRNSENQLSTIYNATSDAMFLMSVEAAGVYRCVSVNAAYRAMTGLSPEQVIGKLVEEVLPASATAYALNRYEEALQKGQTITYDEEVKLGEREISVETRLTPLSQEQVVRVGWGKNSSQAGQGRWVYLLGVSRDISEYKRNQQELRQKEAELRQSHKMEAVGRLAGGIAHDFNNLMTAILGYTDLLLLEQPLLTNSAFDLSQINPVKPERPITIRQDILEIKQTAQRAAGLTHQLLAFSRQQVMHPRDLDVGQVVANLTNMLKRLIGENIKLTTFIEPGPPLLVSADPSQLEQIIVNLAVNARDAIQGEGWLEIGVSAVYLDEKAVKLYSYKVRPDFYICVEVHDNGIGMDSSTLSHIFEPFYTTKSPDQGGGLGLATVYGIVKQSGGYISVESVVGQGTTFKIFLPRLNKATVPSGTFNTHEAVETNKLPAHNTTTTEPLIVLPTKKLTVLLVEDEEPIRRLFVRSLTRQNLQIIEATNGKEALLLAQAFRTRADEERLDLIITDVVLPEMRGPVLVNKVRELFPDIKVILMSGYSVEAVMSQGELAADALFLEKPFDLKTLVLKVQEILKLPSNAK